MGLNTTPVCNKCKGEKIRQSVGAGYRYVCYCEEWKVYLQVLEYARARERKRGR